MSRSRCRLAHPDLGWRRRARGLGQRQSRDRQATPVAFSLGADVGFTKEKESAMRSVGVPLVLAVTPLLLGVAPSEAVAQRARSMMTSPFRPGMGMSRPMTSNSYSPLMGYSPTSSMPYGGYGGYGMSYGGYSAYETPYGGYSGYQTPYGGYDSSSSSYGASSQAFTVPRLPTTDDVEVSGPLDKPPPRRAIVRLRLPDTWADVGFDGKKVYSSGRARTYVTPELPSARTFKVTATWKRNGRTV